MLKDALSPGALVKKAGQEQATGDRQLGVATFDGGPKKPNQRVWSLLGKDEEFVDLMNHPVLDEIVSWYLVCSDLWIYCESWFQC